MSLHAWKLFSKLLLREDDDKSLGLYRFRYHICQPREALKRYLEPVTALNVDFITHLVISGGCDFTTSEMLCLADIKNLGVLELIQPGDDLGSVFPEITDRLVRGWTEKDDPFPLLRVLRIWGDDATTQESLQWVSKFPSLALYDVMGSREDWPAPGVHATNNGWELADTVPGLEDSLLRYLMLFAPLERGSNNRLQFLAKSIDSDLVSLCADSRCAVKFVPQEETPSLLSYLTDSAKMGLPPWDPDAIRRDARACHGTPFEAWAFWLYSFIGQLGQNSDLKRRGLDPDSQAVVGPFVLPRKPLASLFLGHSGRGGITSKPSYVRRGMFWTKRFTFTRTDVLRGGIPMEPQPDPSIKTNLSAPERDPSKLSTRPQKRQRLDDILNTMSG